MQDVEHEIEQERQESPFGLYDRYIQSIREGIEDDELVSKQDLQEAFQDEES